jgi:hypothetical protein
VGIPKVGVQLIIVIVLHGNLHNRGVKTLSDAYPWGRLGNPAGV